MATKNRFTIWATVVAVILFVIAATHQSSQHKDELISALSSSTSKVWPFKTEKTWRQIATEKGTDKVTSHSYYDMYQKYLPALRHKKIKMLEIGLGCDMSYGPGASYYTWLEYFPNVDLYYMEYDAACAKNWSHKTTGATVSTGDQGDPAVLEAFLTKYGSDFDIIIDDGGHTMSQQKTSLTHLWKAIKPGGLYFVEDLETSFNAHYGGGVSGTAGTMVEFIHKIIEDMMVEVYNVHDGSFPRKVVFDDVQSLVHVDCSRQVCVFEKKNGDVV